MLQFIRRLFKRKIYIIGFIIWIKYGFKCLNLDINVTTFRWLKQQ